MGRGDGWQDLVEKSITKYIKMKDDLEVEVESWNPQMNDQDIFNSILVYTQNWYIHYHVNTIYNSMHFKNIYERVYGYDKKHRGDEAKKVGMFYATKASNCTFHGTKL